ncbi:MAG TPA: proline--tRNA ligase [Syntrophorhabdaceae bacterium]|nr:proline--tRNA ligase [Syntrophorhabdaceae bacterium]HOT41159.1 proline--tRNA ligase [Syntrophorhabdaceae bacterium]HQE80282.1 proline--tRNA ligase [Syntrophorhabdaceae bacterium]HQH42459.1 proline--tRNA ligase [Syntrophorhabdaceae bacterium]HQK45768.1 proline--tRNA ligase [Syntrophorhabdaceae bacterium]
MLFSKMFIPTVKEDPKEAEVISHRLMLRAGFIRRLASGIYTWLPLGLKSLRKVENIIREEMNKKGAQEILMPFVQPKELWEESTRWDKYGKELLRFFDRNNRELCLGPTHEEVVTDLVRREIRSYRELPVNLYQIQTKFRDEIRPRFGVMRGREFLMKDAYSFDVDEEGAEKSYRDMYDAYTNIFKRCGFRFRVVEADTGQIGGSFSHEFMVLADTGEDIIISCDACGYAANLERAEVGYPDTVPHSSKKGYFKKVDTPGQRRIDEVSSFLNVSPGELIKTIIYNTDRGVIGVLIRGDREINETKMRNLLSLDYMELADETTIEDVTGGPLGFSGPIGLKIPLYADRDILYMEDFVVGGNERDVHIINANLGDFTAEGFYDIKIAREGDRCPRCPGTLTSTRGIEVGHIFKLGLKYSKAMKATFLDKNGEERYMVMGCYGIGVSRIVAAAIEQGNDENGMILPAAIAPFEVDVLPVNSSHVESMELAEAIYRQLLEKNIDVIFDDRQERPGVKFKDCDLMGIPLRVTIGERNLKEGLVEIKERDKKESIRVKKEEVVRRVEEYVEELKRW